MGADYEQWLVADKVLLASHKADNFGSYDQTALERLVADRRQRDKGMSDEFTLTDRQRQQCIDRVVEATNSNPFRITSQLVPALARRDSESNRPVVLRNRIIFHLQRFLTEGIDLAGRNGL